MFGRRNSDDGFEWHKYVRNTIKLKREQRRQRILDARRAAVHQAGEAGVALAAGSRAAGAAAVDGARVGLGVAGLVLQALWNIVATISAIAWHHLASVSAMAVRKRPSVVARYCRAGAPQHRRPRRSCRCHRAGSGHRPL